MQHKKRSPLIIAATVASAVSAAIFFAEFILLFATNNDYILSYTQIFVPLVCSVVFTALLLCFGEERLHLTLIPFWVMLFNLLLTDSGLYTLMFLHQNIWKFTTFTNYHFVLCLCLISELGITVASILLACKRRVNVVCSIFIYLMLALFVLACVQSYGIFYYGCIPFFVAAILLVFQNERVRPDIRHQIVSNAPTDNLASTKTSILAEDVDIPLTVLLTILTFGIYGIYFAFRLAQKILYLTKNKTDASGELLCLLFVPFYGAVWGYLRADALRAALKAKKIRTPAKASLCLMLGLLGLNIINYILLQYDLNKLAKAYHSTSDGFLLAPVDGERSACAQNEHELIATLKEYKALLDNGTITAEEFDRIKLRLL